MILFYSSDLEQSQTFLEEDEFRHCIKVLRKRIGDKIYLSDGNGTKATAEITEILKSKATLNIIEKEQFKKPDHEVHIAISPTKNRNRWEWFVEKSVEIGVDKIIPLKTFHSERIKLNIERSQKIIRSAGLQSLRAYHPKISDVTNFEKLMQDYDFECEKLIAHFNEDNLHLKSMSLSHKTKLILVGPEGDFSKEELVLAKSHDFKCVNISSNRLRTETAGLVAVNLLS